jgi:hypothetical protein
MAPDPRASAAVPEDPSGEQIRRWPARSGRLCICWTPLIEEGRELSSMSDILADSSYRLLPA